MQKVQIIKRINERVGKDTHSSWYVGIATNVENRLFGEHNVDKEHDGWIHCRADGERIAREAESELLNDYGYSGGIGGGDHPTYDYAYKKNLHTKE